MTDKRNLTKLDRNELIILWGDTIVLNSTHLGQVSRASFMLDWVFDKVPPTPEEVEAIKNDPARKIRDEVLRRLNIQPNQLDRIGNELQSYITGVKNHLLSHGYIKEPNVIDSVWMLKGKGRLMKELGGHRQYQKYRKREIRVLQNQQTNTIAIDNSDRFSGNNAFCGSAFLSAHSYGKCADAESTTDS